MTELPIIQFWPVRPELAELTEAHYRDHIISRIGNLSTIDKVRLVTFDGVAPHITFQTAYDLINYIQQNILDGGFCGTGVEVGAGSGFFTALLANLPEVEKVYAIEISKPIVEHLMPEVVAAYALEHARKVVPCVGDFSYLQLESESADFIFDFFSLHHSDDLTATFKEMARVLKPGGRIVCLDKARADKLTEKDLEALLDKEYTVESKKLMGIDSNQRWTRRMNGEREFRLKDWTSYAASAGLTRETFVHLARTASPNPIKRAAKELLSLLPVSLQTSCAKHFGLARGMHPNHLETSAIAYTATINKFPKEISVVVFRKPQ